GAAYCASKAAISAFSESLASEVRGDGVQVLLVYPGFVPGTAMSTVHVQERGARLATFIEASRRCRAPCVAIWGRHVASWSCPGTWPGRQPPRRCSQRRRWRVSPRRSPEGETSWGGFVSVRELV